MNIEFDYAQLETLKIHYAHSGKSKSGNSDKEKPLLICLHGFPEFWRVWRHQLANLSDQFFVVAPDLRGYNLSDKPLGNEHYPVAKLVEDALALAKHLGYEKFDLVGHDWGGLVAWTLASLQPGVLHKLTIINSPHPRVLQKLLGISTQQVAASSYINKFLDVSAEEKLCRNNYDLLWRFGFKELVEKGVFYEEDRQAHLTAWSQAGAVTAMLASYRAAKFQVPRSEEELPIDYGVSHILANKIKVPTQVIWGMDDTALTPECLDGLNDYVADLTIHKVTKAGHGVIHERPELVSQLLRNFFST